MRFFSFYIKSFVFHTVMCVYVSLKLFYENKEEIKMEQNVIKQETSISQEFLFAVAQDMANANEELRKELVPCQSNSRALDFIKAEIANGKFAAANWKLLCPGSSTYTHTNNFPLDVFEEFSEEILIQLELSNVYISKHKELNTAIIRIIFHF